MIKKRIRFKINDTVLIKVGIYKGNIGVINDIKKSGSHFIYYRNNFYLVSTINSHLRAYLKCSEMEFISRHPDSTALINIVNI